MAGYTPNANSVVHSVQASLDRRGVPDIVHLVQYDRTLPIFAVELTYGDQPFAVPADAEVNVRLRKPDGTHVYDPALGTSEDRRTVYIGVTAQMTTAAGRVTATLEILEGGGVVGTAPILFDVDVNPVPEDAIESTDEYLTLEDLVAQAAASAASAKASETEAGKSRTAAADSASQAEGSAGEAAGSAAEARRQAEAAQGSAEAAGESERNAAQSAETAKQYSGKPPEIDENGFWETWDADAQKYTSTGEKAVNHWDTTYKTVAEMQADKTQPKNTVCIISSDVEQEENAQVYMWDGAKWNFLCDLSGLQGVGIAKIELTAGTHAPGTDDTYTITLTDRREYTFTVHNGSEPPVLSVNGRTGDVTLAAGDVGALPANGKATAAGAADTAAKLAAPRSLKTNLGSTTAVTFDGSVAQDNIPIFGTLAIKNGGTGVQTIDDLRQLVNVYPAIRGSGDWRPLAIQAYNETKDFTSRVVELNTGASAFAQVFRTDAGYGSVMVYAFYGRNVYVLELREGVWSELKQVYPSLHADVADNATNLEGHPASYFMPKRLGTSTVSFVDAAQNAGITPTYHGPDAIDGFAVNRIPGIENGTTGLMTYSSGGPAYGIWYFKLNDDYYTGILISYFAGAEARALQFAYTNGTTYTLREL